MNDQKDPTSPNALSRRAFLRTAAAAIGTGLVARTAVTPAWAQAIGANGDVRVAVIGLNNKGADHVKQLVETPGVRIVALSDVDPRILAREVALLKAKKIEVFAATDARRVLERPDVDAVVIAVGDHWHGLLAIWACQAKKAVYLEKPIARTVWESRKIVEAADKYGVIMQAGTQYRSDPGIAEAVQYVKEGHLGKVLEIRTLYHGLRESTGRRMPWYPDWLDYDLYCGPMAMNPLERNQLHYDWRFTWGGGTGDMANFGVHEVDIARRFANFDAPPRRIMCVGGRYHNPDTGETPNTLVTVFDYPDAPRLTFEHRGMPSKPGVRYQDSYRGLRVGVSVQCEGGYFAGNNGGTVRDNQDKVIKKIVGDGGMGHMANFISAVHSQRKQDLAAPIAVGFASSTVCLYANISYRVGQPAGPDQIRAAFGGNTLALEAFDSMQKHLDANGIDANQQKLTLGPWVNIDAATDGITSLEGASDAATERARYLLREVQRPPYIIPDKV